MTLPQEKWVGQTTPFSLSNASKGTSCGSGAMSSMNPLVNPKPKDTEVVVPTLLFVPCVGYGPGGYRLG